MECEAMLCRLGRVIREQLTCSFIPPPPDARSLFVPGHSELLTETGGMHDVPLPLTTVEGSYVFHSHCCRVKVPLREWDQDGDYSPVCTTGHAVKKGHEPQSMRGSNQAFMPDLASLG